MFLRMKFLAEIDNYEYMLLCTQYNATGYLT